MKKTYPQFKMLPIAFGIATMALTAMGTVAHAQASKVNQIEEIVITAKKIAESQQSVPISVTAYSAENLKQSVIQSVADLGSSATGLVVAANSQGGAPTFAVRGTKTDNGVDGGVAIYLDDMPVVSSNGVINSFYDMSSVEILKGPQGTLFGVNTTGGVISFRAKKPTNKFEAYADVGFGNFKRKEFEGMINVPISDVLQVRVAANIVRRDGFVTNVNTAGGAPSKLSDDRHESLRFSARIKPNADITNDVVVDYYNEDDKPRQAVPVAFLPVSTLTAANLFPFGEQKVSLGGNPSGVTLPLFNKQKIWGIQDVLSWAVSDNMSIKNVLGYRKDKSDSFEDNDGTYLNLVNGRTLHENKEVVNDFTVRLTSMDNRLRYTGGIYLSHTKRDDGNAYNLAQNFGVLGFFGPFVPGVSGPKNQLSASIYSRDFHSTAVYSQAEYDLTKELTVTGGLRYNWDKGKFTANNNAGLGLPDAAGNFTAVPAIGIFCSPFATSSMPSFNPATCTGSNAATWKAPSYTFVISDKFSDKSMLWFKVSGGYLAGGFNNQIFETAYQTFRPEKAREFETGIKSDWTLAGRPIRTNLQVFYGNSSQKQEVENGAYANGTNWIAVFNAGSMTYYGADAEVKYLLTNELELSATWTHVDAHYDNFNFPAVGTLAAANLTGNTPAQIPEDTVNLGLTYQWPISSGMGKLSTSFNSYYRSKTNFHDVANLGTFGADADTGKSYTLSNLNVSWDGIMGSRFDASLWVKNVFDKKYMVYRSAQAALGYAHINWGDPRTIGARLRYNF